ncbi:MULTISPECIES: ATP-binding protein [Marinomonas]|uniref:histidine kinase n=1 Tax=Marinomonas arctica TaxID=383750 RepID=A0A7H1J666_9GAMM|nr:MULTISPECIES: ATP-binding protein [Marinomonas]QNT05982.1 ATP-binding protein [Marinomonas arctica]GGN19753.1 histidine kinase [Marinomonas arctica]
MEKQFKVSSALKNIIGKDLIVDDFVAIFELVKNSFDANSRHVEVSFENIVEGESKLIIQDDGKGMDLDDIDNKWLFVAYSAKKEGTEDYRDEIKSKRIHAGAKGIGRFSCDRLGEKLSIYSRRNENDEFSKLTIDWIDFESDMKTNFDSINVNYELIDNCPYELLTGTILEISSLRSNWDAEKLIRLRQSLEKLINPSQNNNGDSFSITLNAPDFLEHDDIRKDTSKEHEIINGPIKNFLFEKLGLKTTKIEVSIDSEGSNITTKLYDRGIFIYELKEKNIFITSGNNLRDININLFALSTTTKTIFTKHMGVRPVRFGSVFVYKNGFRILPIGELGRGDVFGLDNRKQQGQMRYFGTRDLFGRVEINGENEELKESSSRDGGLERNETFLTLNSFFMEKALKRLERYAIDVVKFGNVENIDVSDLKQSITQDDKALIFIEALTKSEDIIDIKYNPELFDIVSDSSEKSLKAILKNLSRIAVESNNIELDKEVKKIKSRLADFQKLAIDSDEEAGKERKAREHAEKQARLEAERARQEAEKARAAESRAQDAEKKSDEVFKESLFLKSMMNSDLDNIIALHHHIGIAAGTIENYVRNVSNKIRSGKPVSTETFLHVLDEISYVTRQIKATTNFATKANFNLEAEIITENIYSYIQEYVLNICSGLVKVDGDFRTDINFIWKNVNPIEFNVQFRPLEIAMVIDTMINNAVKAKAKKITFSAEVIDNGLDIYISDDGKGIEKSIRDKIFDMGFTTTKGSGLGLHHAKNIMEKINGNIELLDAEDNKANFVLTFTR